MNVRLIPLALIMSLAVTGLSGCSVTVAAPPHCAISAVRFYPVQTDPNGKPVRQVDAAITMPDNDMADAQSAAFKAFDETTHAELHGTAGSSALLPVGHSVKVSATVTMKDGSTVVCTPRSFVVPAATAASSPAPQSA